MWRERFSGPSFSDWFRLWTKRRRASFCLRLLQLRGTTRPAWLPWPPCCRWLAEMRARALSSDFSGEVRKMGSMRNRASCAVRGVFSSFARNGGKWASVDIQFSSVQLFCDVLLSHRVAEAVVFTEVVSGKGMRHAGCFSLHVCRLFSTTSFARRLESACGLALASSVTFRSIRPQAVAHFPSCASSSQRVHSFTSMKLHLFGPCPFACVFRKRLLRRGRMGFGLREDGRGSS